MPLAIGEPAGIGSLRGDHNAQNAAAAVAVALASDVAAGRRSAPAFTPSPACRIAWRRSAGVGEALFINDSKATNADSTEKALKSFDDILWILGGKAKEGGIEPLKPYFPKIAQGLSDRRGVGGVRRDARRQVPYVHCGTLDTAVEQAAQPTPQALRREPSCCCRRPARPTTSIRISRCAETTSAISSGPCPASNRRWGLETMVSRAERSAFGDWWWTVDRLAARSARRPDAGGPRLPHGRRAAGRGAARTLDLPFREPAGAVPRPGPRASCSRVSFLSLRHVRRLALAGLCGRHGADPAGVPVRPRDQGRASLDHDRPARHPAVRVREARLRGARRLGLLGRRAAQGHAGHAAGASCSCRPPSSRSSCSPISARPCSSPSCGAACSSSPACTGSG